jgi:hypothetical protein
MNPLLTKELGLSPEMAVMMDLKAEAAAAEARAIAPVGQDPDPDPGEFRDSIEGSVGEKDGVIVGRVSSDDPAAPYIIFGTSDTPPHDTLLRAVETTSRL